MSRGVNEHIRLENSFVFERARNVQLIPSSLANQTFPSLSSDIQQAFAPFKVELMSRLSDVISAAPSASEYVIVSLAEEPVPCDGVTETATGAVRGVVGGLGSAAVVKDQVDDGDEPALFLAITFQ